MFQKEMLMSVRLVAALPVVALLLGHPAELTAQDKKKEDADIKITAVLPKEGISLKAVNSGETAFKLRVENKGKKEAVVSPYYGLTVQDDKGKEVPVSLSIGSGP